MLYSTTFTFVVLICESMLYANNGHFLTLCIFWSGTDPISPLILFLFFHSSCSSSWGDTLQNSQSHRRLKSDWDELWQDCCSSRCTLTDGLRFQMWHHTFKMAATHRKVLPSAVCPVHMQLPTNTFVLVCSLAWLWQKWSIQFVCIPSVDWVTEVL